MMVVKYIDTKTKKEIVTLNTGYIPRKGEIITTDTLPSNPIKYIIMDIAHLIYIPPIVKDSGVAPVATDEIKIYVTQITKRRFGL